MTPKELYYAFKSYHKEREISQRYDALIMRLHAFATSMHNCKTLNEFMPFEWEKVEKKPIEKVKIPIPDWDKLDKE